MADNRSSAAQPKATGFNPVRFLREVSAEMKKVTFAGKRELAMNTAVVSIVVAIVCFLIWICDSFFQRLFNLILK